MLNAYIENGCFEWQIASDGLKHRVFEVSLADLQGDEEHAFRKIRLRAEDVQGKNLLTNFWVWYVAEPSIGHNVVCWYSFLIWFWIFYFLFTGDEFHNWQTEVIGA